MAYQQQESVFEELIDKALAQQEIQDGLKKAGLKPERVTADIKAQAQLVWGAAANHIAYYDDTEKKLEIDLELVRKAAPPPPRLLRLLNGLKGFLEALPFLLLFAYLGLGLFVGWKTPFLWFTETLGLTYTIILIGVIAAGSVAALMARRRLHAKYQQESASAVTEKSKELGISDTRWELARARSEVESAAIESIRREIRADISSRIDDSYERKLSIEEAPGLSEVFDSDYEIDTAAKRKLSFMLDTMPGGSIGIAGPRGAGKTTLIYSFCNESITEIKNRKVLPLMTSAPVEYEPRDFLLHLFASLCHRILERSNSEYKPIDWKSTDEIQKPLGLEIIRLIPFVIVLCFVTGSLLTLTGLAIAYQNVRVKSAAAQPTPTPTPQSDQPKTTSPEPRPSGEPPAQKQPADASSQPPSMLDELGFHPPTLFKWGLLLILASVVMYLVTWLKVSDFKVVREDVIPTDAPMPEVLSDFNPQALRLKEKIQSVLASFINVFWNLKTLYDVGRARQSGEVLAPHNSPVRPELIKEANKWLKEIKFQQSYTSGWSGALKLPVGLEGGVNAAVSLAQRQLSLPEIVAGFVGFLKSISRDYRVIIGIDELDKLENEQKAQQFLNEIKAIFGLNRVFYLISVSESAMSNFEQRGLPFRDVFDSSFDNIVHVNYLKFEDARVLLGRRVLGMPIPFLGLCYCLSGGLPRDLIRSCRNLIEINSMPQQDNDLSSLSAALIKSELSLKTRAVSISVERINMEPARSNLLEKLYQLETESAPVESLMTYYSGLLSLSNDVKTQAEVRSEEDIATVRKMASRVEELAAYFYYMITLYQYITSSDLSHKDGRAMLDLLAKAHQALSINPVITRSILKGFRERNKMVD